MFKLERIQFIPKKIFIIYICITFFLFIMGPIQYEFIGFKEITNVCLYMILFVFMAGFAYDSGVKKELLRYKTVLRLGKRRIDQIDAVNLSIIYTVLLYLLLIIQNNNIHGVISFNNFNYFSMMAETYTYVDYETTLSGWLLSYTAIFRIIAVGGGVYYWDRNKSFYKVSLCILVCLIIINNTFFIGSQKQTIDLFIYVVIALTAKSINDNKKIEHKTVIFIAVAIVIAIIIMGLIINARVELWVNKYNAIAPGMPQRSYLKSDSFFYRIMPNSILSAMIYLSGYFSQGYRGLALCLNENFVPTWGMGFSFKIMNDYSRWFGIPLELIEKSYPVRMSHDYGIGAYSNWHSIFPWFASDVTFFGAIIVVCGFIYLWGRAWKEWIDTKNLWPLLLFSHLTILVLFIPCNNQLFQTRESIVATLLLFIFWIVFRGKIKTRLQ